tara:strand:- start:65 stop:352 length:288 start_codon:yes stop_codon:yes gene_type:complete
MLKSEILEELHKKHKNLKIEDIELLFNIFINKISNSLNLGKKIEIRGFGTISRKINKEKMVRNPKTNEKLFKNQSYKLHFKIGKVLHKKINDFSD